MLKWVSGIILAALTALAAWLAFIAESAARWTADAFWMLLGAGVTTFLLDALLKRDMLQRGQREAEFGFRAFVASTLVSIAAVVRLEPDADQRIVQAILKGNAAFAEAAEELAARIASAVHVSSAEYQSHSPSIGGALQKIGFDYVRLYSRKDEMAANLLRLTELARRWGPRTPMFESEGGDEPPHYLDADRKAVWRTELQASRSEVLATARDSAACLVEFARAVAAGKGIGVSDL